MSLDRPSSHLKCFPSPEIDRNIFAGFFGILHLLQILAEPFKYLQTCQFFKNIFGYHRLFKCFDIYSRHWRGARTCTRPIGRPCGKLLVSGGWGTFLLPRPLAPSENKSLLTDDLYEGDWGLGPEMSARAVATAPNP